MVVADGVTRDVGGGWPVWGWAACSGWSVWGWVACVGDGYRGLEVGGLCGLWVAYVEVGTVGGIYFSQ